MNLFDRLRAAYRAFTLGKAVIQPGDEAWGHDIAEWAPEEYGNYIATSNGVYACATQRAQFLASLPMGLFKLKANGERSEVESGQLYGLLQKVNPFWTFTRLIEMTELSLCLWGQAFWFLERGDAGVTTPSEIWWGRPDRVRVIPHPEKYVAGYYYCPTTGSQDIYFRPGEVIWIRYPNPVDEYAPLSPLAAARLGADYASAAMKSNKNLFDNGIQMGGMVAPRAGNTFTEDQAKAIGEALDRRFKGLDKAHRWGVFRFDAEVKPVGFNPREAEFVEGLRMALEDVCRAYHWPLDLVGGQRTYENVNAAMRAAWTNCVLPEARFIASEMTEQLLPMFPNQADLAEFDSDDVDVLQEERNARWTRTKEQITIGYKTINEARDEDGLDPVQWGNAWWAPMSLVPTTDAEPKELPAPAADTQPAEEQAGEKPMPTEGEAPAPEAESENEDAGAEQPRAQTRAVDYNSPEHVRLWTRFIRRTTPHEKELSRVVVALFERMQDSVLARLRQRGQRTPADAAGDPFDRAQWIRRFRTETRPVLRTITEAAAQAALDDLALTLVFNVDQPAVVRFLEGRAQRFAKHVTETTWQRLKDSLQQGIEAGENITQLEERVKTEMAGRIRSTPEAIARTEVIGCANGGTIEAWRQSGVVKEKVWLSTPDDRTRTPDRGDEFDHVGAHGETVGIDEPFVKTGEPLDYPCGDGSAANVCNCRCAMDAVL